MHTDSRPYPKTDDHHFGPGKWFANPPLPCPECSPPLLLCNCATCREIRKRERDGR